ARPGPHRRGTHKHHRIAARRTASAPRGCQVSVDFPSDAGDDSWQRSDVVDRRPEVDDAGPQVEASVDDRVREVRLAAGLDPGEKRGVEVVQVLAVRGAVRHVAERRDAEAGRAGLELRLYFYEPVELASERTVVRDHAHVSGAADLAERQP